MIKGVVVGAVVAGGAILATLAYCFWREDQAPQQQKELVPPVPTELPKTPDSEDAYEHELGLITHSFPREEALEFGRVFDAVGSLISSCPSNEGSKRLSDVTMIGICCRNRLWGLSGLVEYGNALMGLHWAESEMRRVINDFGPSAEWKKSGLALTVQYFGILQQPEHGRLQTA